MKPKSQVFDPIRGPAFEIRGTRGLLFSNAGTSLWLISGEGIHWPIARLQTIPALMEGGAVGWVAVSPWVPGAAALRSELDALLGPPRVDRPLATYTFPANKETFKQIFDIWERNGAWSSGEWVIATLVDAHQPSSKPGGAEALGGFPDGVLLANAAHVGCGIALSEQQQSLAIVNVDVVSERSLLGLVGAATESV